MRRDLFIDLTPLRVSRPFRWLFEGQVVTMVGGQLTALGVAYQVYALTHSSLQVGAVSLAQLPLFVVGTLSGGAFGGTVDRRRLLGAASLLLAVSSGGLALNAAAASGASLVAIYLLTALNAGLTGLVATVTTAAVPALVGPEQLTAAYTGMQVIDQIGMIAGPLAAGVLIAVIGLPGLFGVDAATSLWCTFFLVRMAASLPRPTARRPGSGGPSPWRAFFAGFGYLRGRSVLQGVYLIDLCATVFGLPRALFPELTATVFHGGSATLGLLAAAPAAGALAGSLTSGWLAGVKAQGRAVVAAVVVWGAIIVAFGWTTMLWVALVLLAAAGWADLVSAVLRSTMAQRVTDDEFRHHVSGIQSAVVEGGPRLGDLESGAVASVSSARLAVVSGGLVTIVGAALVALLLPGFRRSRSGAGPASGHSSPEEP